MIIYFFLLLDQESDLTYLDRENPLLSSGMCNEFIFRISQNLIQLCNKNLYLKEMKIVCLRFALAQPHQFVNLPWAGK